MEMDFSPFFHLKAGAWPHCLLSSNSFRNKSFWRLLWKTMKKGVFFHILSVKACSKEQNIVPILKKGLVKGLFQPQNPTIRRESGIKLLFSEEILFCIFRLQSSCSIEYVILKYLVSVWYKVKFRANISDTDTFKFCDVDCFLYFSEYLFHFMLQQSGSDTFFSCMSCHVQSFSIQWSIQSGSSGMIPRYSQVIQEK